MPSFDHEAILEILRHRPSLVPELARERLRERVPAEAHVQVADTSLSEVVPTERKADLVLLLSSPPSASPTCALVVEVQLGVDRDKRWAWWWYLASVHARHRCDVALIVIAPDPSVAAWAARPLALGHPDVSLCPIVLGPNAVPIVSDGDLAAKAPELAVLSAMMHGKSNDAERVGRAALAALRGLDDERAALYTDIVLVSMHAAARAVLEELMANGTYEYQSDFAKRYVEKGRNEGEARGRALAVLAVLDARGIDIPAAVRGRVLGCTDVTLLDRWIARAALASSAEDVVAE